MIRVDDRIGSREFVRLLRRAGIRARKHRLRFADFSFFGNGPHGRVRIGVERKTVSEIVSAIGDNRFVGHQLPGLLGNRPDGRRRYDYVMLIIEGGIYFDARTGLLNPQAFGRLQRRAHVYRTVKKFLFSLRFKGTLHLEYTRNKTETAEVIAALYEWFDDSWRSHTSVYKVDESKPDVAILADRTMKRKVANQLTQLAWVRTVKADHYFPSIAAMVVGDPDYKMTEPYKALARSHWRLALGFKKEGKIVHDIVEVCARRDDVKAKGR